MNVSLVILPLLIVITGLYYVTSLQRINRIRTFETDAAEVLESMRYYAATEKYICTSLAAVFDANQDPAGLKSPSKNMRPNMSLNSDTLSITLTEVFFTAIFSWTSPGMITLRLLRFSTRCEPELSVQNAIFLKMPTIIPAEFTARTFFHAIITAVLSAKISDCAAVMQLLANPCSG